MNGEHGFAIDFLDLVGTNKLMHARFLPLVLAVPQNSVQRAEQGADIPLLALYPIMHLVRHKSTYKLYVNFIGIQHLF